MKNVIVNFLFILCFLGLAQAGYAAKSFLEYKDYLELPLNHNNEEQLFEFSFENNEVIESISLTVDLTHENHWDLSIYLLTPSGKKISLYDEEHGGEGAFRKVFTAENSELLEVLRTPLKGKWVVIISDNFETDAGIIHSITLEGKIKKAGDGQKTFMEYCEESYNEMTPTGETIRALEGYVGASGCVQLDEQLNMRDDLYLHGAAISDLEPISALRHIKSLSLAGKDIKDIRPLASMTNLRFLDIENAQLQDITPLSVLIKLESLKLNGCELSDISVLSSLINLETLLLNNNEITDIESLSFLTLLTDLELSGNNIFDVFPLSSVVSLRYLMLQNNRIKDISPLASLYNLTVFLMEDNPLGNTGQTVNGRVGVEKTPLNCPVGAEVPGVIRDWCHGGSSTEYVWHSYDAYINYFEEGSWVIEGEDGTLASLELYRSGDNIFYAEERFSSCHYGLHDDGFNKVQYWCGAGLYPYVGKSTVPRGEDEGEVNVPFPSGVHDLQLHPPENNRYTVAAFKVPMNGAYKLKNLGVRRVSDQGGRVLLKVFNSSGELITLLEARNDRNWTTSSEEYTLGTLTVGASIYFAVDGAEDFNYDSTEVSFTIEKNGEASVCEGGMQPGTSTTVQVVGGSLTKTCSVEGNYSTSLTCHQGFKEGEGGEVCEPNIRINSSNILEVYHDNEWRDVCDDNFDIADAKVACKQLGYNYVGYYNIAQTSGANFWLDELGCDGSEDMLMSCIENSKVGQHDCSKGESVSLTCLNHRPARITGENDALEVFRNDEWRGVCSDSFDGRDAQVACRELGFSYPIEYKTQLMGPSSSFWYDDLECSGNEDFLGNCGSPTTLGENNCSENEHVSVNCSHERPIKTTGENNILKVFYNNEWRGVCDDNFDHNDAVVACRQMGYSYVKEFLKGQAGEVANFWLDELNCSGEETLISECPVGNLNNGQSKWGKHDCSVNEHVSLVCTDQQQIRLNGEQNNTLEVHKDGAWQAVCDQGFSHMDAYVACRQRGYKYLDSFQTGVHADSTSFGVSGLQCSGEEWGLLGCLRQQGPVGCGSSQHVTLSCSNDEAYPACSVGPNNQGYGEAFTCLGDRKCRMMEEVPLEADKKYWCLTTVTPGTVEQNIPIFTDTAVDPYTLSSWSSSGSSIVATTVYSRSSRGWIADFTYSSSDAIAYFQQDGSTDLSNYTNLVFDIKVVHDPRSEYIYTIRMDSTYPKSSQGSSFIVDNNEWQTIRMSLRTIRTHPDSTLDITKVNTPFVIYPTNVPRSGSIQIYLDNIYLER